MLRMIAQYSWCWASLSVLALSCSSVGNTFVKYQGTSFSVAVPSTVRVSKSSPVEDFELYQFSEQGEKLLEVYVGNHPNFPKSFPPSAVSDQIPINGLQAKIVRWRDQEGNMFCECLVQLGAEAAWPSLLHAKYTALSKDRAIIAERIISSVNRKL